MHSLCVFSPTCGTALALEHNGDMYSCDHFVEPGYLLGNIDDTHMIELVASDRQREFGQDKQDLPRNTVATATSVSRATAAAQRIASRRPLRASRGLNYLCPSFRLFFGHVRSPMRAMSELLAADRAPAEIMDGLRLRGLPTRPQRSVHVRQRPEMEELPRGIAAVLTTRPRGPRARTASTGEARAS